MAVSKVVPHQRSPLNLSVQSIRLIFYLIDCCLFPADLTLVAICLSRDAGKAIYLYLEEIMYTCFFRFTLLLLAFAALFAACGADDNPVDGDDQEHADADGFTLKVDGNEIYRQFQGTHEGGITLKVGEELDVLAMFLDHDGDEFLPAAAEEDDEHDHDEEEVFALAIVEFDSSIIEVHLYEDEGDEHADEGEDHEDELAEKFTFEVKGLIAGETTAKLQLLHGDHPDFTGALLIPVTVTP